MQRYEMEDAVKNMVADDRYDGIVPLYLDMAQSAVMNRLYPLEPDVEWVDVPERFHGRTCEIAVYLINKRGAEGELSHRENGTERVYESASIPASMFAGMVPFAGVPRKADR